MITAKGSPRGRGRPPLGPDPAEGVAWWLRLALLVAFAAWGLQLVRLDVADGDIDQSFIHGPLLVFHEAGHVLFMPLGAWMTVLGGTLGQLLVPLVLAVALGWKNRDAFGAALGAWLFGVSLLDVAPYMYDALHPQLTLLNGATGEEGGHDWIFLFSSMHLLPRAQRIGMATHALGAITVLLSILAAAAALAVQRLGRADDARR